MSATTFRRAVRAASHRPFIILLLALFTLASARAEVLWRIGQADRHNGEFALAPKGYGKFRDDGFFVIGRSDPKRDWPYVHPGPHDSWAGGSPHTFTVAFGVKSALAAGECVLTLDLLDTQSRTPPELRIDVNGKSFTRKLPPGAGDDSVYGNPAKGKPHRVELTFPANLLKAGANAIDITTTSGSWLLYDALALNAPAGVELADAQGTVLSAVRSQPVLVERNGNLFQLVRASVRHFGDAAPARVLLNGVEATNLMLGSGAQNLELPFAAVDKETPVTVALEVAGRAAGTQTVTLKPVRKWVVYLLPHSHVDIGYTHVQTDVERAQWKYLEMAMEAAQRSAGYPEGARFKWNVEVLWAVDSYLQQATREQRNAFFAAVKAGHIGLEALYGNMLTGLCRPEEMLRMLRLGPELAKRTGVPVETAMITDVPGYTWGIVPALAHTGVKYFSIGPNGGDRIGHTIAAWGDKPFWWVGPNGRDKLLVWMTGTGYYQVYQSAEKLMSYLASLEAKSYPYDFVQVRHCLGDNGAPDVNFAAKVKAWNETHAYPKLVIATADEMFRAFEQRYGDKLPTVSGDFTPYWEDGAASSARETALNRAAADRLVQAETLFAMFNPGAYPIRDFYTAWRNVVLYDEHTWGAHNSISQPDHPFVKSQWAIKQQFALDADAQARELIRKALGARPGELRTEENANVIDVISTVAHAMPNTLVTIPKELSTAGDVVSMDTTNSGAFVSQRLSTGELVFRPCSGTVSERRYRVIAGTPRPLSAGACAEGNTLVTSNSMVAAGLTLRVDEKSGAIASLVFRGRELVDTNAATALNDYFYLPGSDVKKVQRNGPVKISVKEKGPLIASLLVESEAPGCRKLTREYRLHALRGYVEIIDTVDKQAVRAKEGVHFGFGFNVPGGTVRMDVPWAVVRPELDQIPGACKNWFTVQRWVDISNDRFGVTWMTPDAPLVEIGGLTANLIGSLSDTRAWKNKIEPSTTIYSWAMNNHWHTNYRAEQDGPTVFRYFIWPHEGDFDAARAARDALELSQPLIVAPARGSEPRLKLLSLSNARVQVTALKPSDDGRALIVRLFGASGTAETVKLHWHTNAPARILFSDNSERPGAVAGDTIEVPAFGIVTLRAELAK